MRGEWDECIEYAAGEMDVLDMMPEHLRPYFDFKRWSRALPYNYSTGPAHDGGVVMFHNY